MSVLCSVIGFLVCAMNGMLPYVIHSIETRHCSLSLSPGKVNVIVTFLYRGRCATLPQIHVRVIRIQFWGKLDPQRCRGVIVVQY